MTVSLVECPPTKLKAASVPRKPAIARSNSPCRSFSPEARRLAETLVP